MYLDELSYDRGHKTIYSLEVHHDRPITIIVIVNIYWVNPNIVKSYVITCNTLCIDMQ